MENNTRFSLESVEFEGFLGYIKPRIKTFKANFDKKLQILTATNGCGKSTTISELNPFPIEKSLFTKEGYKVIIFSYNSKRYKVVSSHKRNDLIDLETNENLNDGGTITQHLALIKQLFNIDPFTWSIAMGSINFTDVDKNTRRLWVERISGIDFNYPFTLYKKVTGEMSSLKGAYKHINSQLATEAGKLISVEELNDLVQLKDNLTQSVKRLLLANDTSISPNGKLELERDISRLERTAKELQLNYNKLGYFINPFSHLGSIDNLREEVMNTRVVLSGKEKDQEQVIKALEERSELILKLEGDNGFDSVKVGSELTRLKTVQGEVRGVLQSTECNSSLMKVLSNIEVASNFYKVVNNLEIELSEYLTTGCNFTDSSLILPYPRDTYQTKVNLLNHKHQEITRLETGIRYLEDDLENVKNGKEVVCTNCNTTFLPGEDKVAHLTKEIKSNNALLTKLNLEVEDLVATTDAYTTITSNRELVTHYIRKQVYSSSPWYMSTVEGYLDSDITLSALMSNIKRDSYTAYNLEKGLGATERIKTLESLLREHEAIKNVVDGEVINKEVAELEAKLNGIRGEIRSTEVLLKEMEHTGKTYKKHITLLNDLQATLTTLSDKRIQLVKVLNNVALEAVESDLQVQLATITKKVNDNEILTNLISKLESMLEKTQGDLEILKVIEKAFNPTNGLIAEQLVGYVTQFTKQISSVVDQLWGYPMEVLPCNIEGKKGMDYKFPFKVGDSPVPDISKGSKSQVSVINLAVMLATRANLELEGLPMFLDEVGGGFDTVHNEKLSEFIRSLLNHYHCSNVFLVHHDVSVRNSLGPYDTIVFDASQVIVDSHYNEHVEITYYKE